MTQSQQPPQMPPPEPLDEQERMLARALRNLPVGTPPPELDARILGAARRAVHLAPPRRNNQRRWLVGFGTAASALLAFGVLLKTHGPARDEVYTPPAETQKTNAAPATIESLPPVPAKSAAMPVGESPMGADAAAASATAPQPPSGIASEMPARQKDAPAQEREEQSANDSAALAARASPQPFPVQRPKVIAPLPSPSLTMSPPVVADEPMPMSAPAPPPPPPAERAERKAEKSDQTRRDKEAGAFAATPPAATGGTSGEIVRDQAAAEKPASNAMQSNPVQSDSTQARDAISKQSELDEISVTGSQVKRVNGNKLELDERLILPSLDNDSKLSPMQWIERIRVRVGAADRNGARESMRRFHIRYPQTAIPEDLLPLLR